MNDKEKILSDYTAMYNKINDLTKKQRLRQEIDRLRQEIEIEKNIQEKSKKELKKDVIIQKKEPPDPPKSEIHNKKLKFLDSDGTENDKIEYYELNSIPLKINIETQEIEIGLTLNQNEQKLNEVKNIVKELNFSVLLDLLNKEPEPKIN